MTSRITLIAFSVLIMCSIIYAQEDTTGETIIMKDEDENSLFTITDEGSAGSLLLNNAGAISISTNKLYNNGGNLYWSGSQITTGSGGASEINDLADAKYDGSSLFLGNYSGHYDDGSSNRNTAVGRSALYANTKGYDNTAMGYCALYDNTEGYLNTAFGSFALRSNSTGEKNTAVGAYALYANTLGGNNTVIGYHALSRNTEGGLNTAIGNYALYSNVAGNYGVAIGFESQRYVFNNSTEWYNHNTSVGYQSLRGSTIAENNMSSQNSAFGCQSMFSNSSGCYNTANGYQSLYSNKWGEGNTAIGYQSLYLNTYGNYNTANGYHSLYSNTSGDRNTANGRSALYNNTSGIYNTAIGYNALYDNETGNKNTAVGYDAGPSSSNFNNTTALGYNAVPTASNQVRIGNSSVTSIGGYAAWSNLSDARYKLNVRSDVSGLEFIMRLNPVTYNLNVNRLSEDLHENYEIDIDGNRVKSQPSPEMQTAREKKASVRQAGFIAQEVENLVNDLGIDFSGVEAPENEQSMYRLRYSEFVVPLVKAVQEQQFKIKELEDRISQLEASK